MLAPATAISERYGFLHTSCPGMILVRHSVLTCRVTIELDTVSFFLPYEWKGGPRLYIGFLCYKLRNPGHEPVNGSSAEAATAQPAFLYHNSVEWSRWSLVILMFRLNHTIQIDPGGLSLARLPAGICPTGGNRL